MPTAKEIITELKALGSEGYKKIILRHGVTEPCFGVKVADLKKIQKRVKKDYRLALELYDSGIYDAMYLAGLIADDAQMTKADLHRWVQNACAPLAGSVVPWVAAGSPHAREIAREWIDAKRDIISTAGWSTWSSLVALKPDAELDLTELKQLLHRVEKTIHTSPNSTRYAMNGFIIAVGSYVQPLTALAVELATKIGEVTVDMGQTACEVPFAPVYIRKVQEKGALGKKRKSVKP